MSDPQQDLKDWFADEVLARASNVPDEMKQVFREFVHETVAFELKDPDEDSAGDADE